MTPGFILALCAATVGTANSAWGTTRAIRRFAWIACVAPMSAACDQPFERVIGCVESEQAMNLFLPDGLRVSGAVVDGAGFVASEPCATLASHELFVMDADGVRFRFSWQHPSISLDAAPATADVDVEAVASATIHPSRSRMALALSP